MSWNTWLRATAAATVMVCASIVASLPASGASKAIAHGAKATPAPASTPAVAPKTIRTLDGITTIDVWPAANALPGAQSPAVLVIPGWGVPAREYSDLATFLSGRGFVVAVLAHGDDSDAIVQDWDVYAEDGLDTLLAGAISPWSPLFQEIDVQRVGLLGHSLGAAAAVIVASHDLRLKALAISGPQCSDMSFIPAAVFVQAPVIAIDGSLDRLAPPNICSASVIAAAATPDKAALVIRNGSHKNCPADYDERFILDFGRWVWQAIPTWPYAEWQWEWPVVPGVVPMHGADQRAIAFPYLGAWFDRYVAGKKTDPQGWTTGKQADAAVASGVLTEDLFSASARKGP